MCGLRRQEARQCGDYELKLAWQQSVRADIRRRVVSEGRSHAVWFEEACGYGAGAWLEALPQPYAIPGGPAGY